jgi:hypothetical protein
VTGRAVNGFTGGIPDGFGGRAGPIFSASPGRAESWTLRTGGTQWLATCSFDLARARYRSRAARRDAGHLDDARSEQELWGNPSEPLGLAPLIEVDTSGPVDVPRLASDITRMRAKS